jgi:hypothetical protein
VPAQKAERRSHHTDNEVQLLVAVLLRVVLAQHLLVMLVGELRRFIDSEKNCTLVPRPALKVERRL